MPPRGAARLHPPPPPRPRPPRSLLPQGAPPSSPPPVRRGASGSPPPPRLRGPIRVPPIPPVRGTNPHGAAPLRPSRLRRGGWHGHYPHLPPRRGVRQLGARLGSVGLSAAPLVLIVPRFGPYRLCLGGPPPPGPGRLAIRRGLEPGWVTARPRPHVPMTSHLHPRLAAPLARLPAMAATATDGPTVSTQATRGTPPPRSRSPSRGLRPLPGRGPRSREFALNGSGSNYTTGANFSRAMSLPAGSHAYSFKATSGSGHGGEKTTALSSVSPSRVSIAAPTPRPTATPPPPPPTAQPAPPATAQPAPPAATTTAAPTARATAKPTAANRQRATHRPADQVAGRKGRSFAGRLRHRRMVGCRHPRATRSAHNPARRLPGRRIPHSNSCPGCRLRSTVSDHSASLSRLESRPPADSRSSSFFCAPVEATRWHRLRR